uniref:Uncharacterized protein n=1 Tax=Glossina morsitans morsitans TaxID=37546 RepID=A0A1B0F9Z1_GLOMM
MVPPVPPIGSGGGQRFLAQRSAMTATAPLCRTQLRCLSAVSSKRRNFLGAALIAAVAPLDGVFIVLNCNHLTVVNRLRELCNKSQNFQPHLEIVNNGFRATWLKMASKLLSGCTSRIPSDHNASNTSPNITLTFFTIECLCDIVINLLLNKTEE